MKFKSIMTQLCVYISVFILCICVIFCFIATNLSQSALTNSLNESLLKITEQSSAVVAERIKTYYSELTALAQNEIFYDLTLNKEKIITLLKQVKNDEGHLDIMVSDIQGNTFSADNVETNISDRNYFQEALKGNNFVSDPILRNTDKKMIMVFTSPIKNASGNIIGIIAIVRSGHELSDILSKITYAKTGYAYATNKAGTVVGHQDASLVDSFYNTINEAKTDADMQQLADLTRKMMSGQNGTGSYKYKGVIKYLGYSPIEGTEWSIALSAPHEEVFAEINSLTLIMILCSIVLVILGIIAAMILAKGFQKPIKKLVGVSERLAKGDLDIQISLDRKDELGTLANTLLTVSDNMSELLSDIRIASEQVASGAVQISESSEEISQGATEQASSVEELTAAIEEIASQTKLNAENAGKVDTITKESKKVAEIGNEKMKYMLKAMDDINVSSKSISKIIKAIDDIAFQTNILALNAAVEAARAGQHGKGFAVVAEEVRNLAAKSANAAKETTDLIEGSINKVEGGTKIAVETAEELKRIVEGVSNAAVLVEEISVSTKEQATGIEQVNQGLMQVSQVIQANSATSQESAAASEELSGQATILKEQISKFKLKDIRAKAKGENSQISPDVLKALDGMKQKKDEQKVESKSSSQKTKISLSDTEFGKY